MVLFFVHSFSANPDEKEDIVAYVNYQGMRIVAAIAKENIFGTQFHPEKRGGWTEIAKPIFRKLGSGFITKR